MQSSLLARLTVLGARFDLLLLVVLVWGSLREMDEAIIWGLIGGAFLDLFSAAPFGTGVLSLGLVGALAGTLGGLLRRANGLLVLVFAALATILFDLVLAFVLEAQGWAVDWPATVALVVLPGCVLNAIGTPLVYWLLRAADARLQPATWLG